MLGMESSGSWMAWEGDYERDGWVMRLSSALTQSGQEKNDGVVLNHS